MKHDKLTRKVTRYCVECDRDQIMFTVAHKTFNMYHCTVCKEEVARARDGEVRTMTPNVNGFVDVRELIEDGHTKPPVILAKERADVLSDEHSLWPPRDNEEREEMLRTFKAALSGLTARQKQVLDAVERSGSVSRAAQILGISQPAVTMTIQKIAKKIGKKVII